MHFNIHVRLLAVFLVLWASGVSADGRTRFGKPVKSNSQESLANVLPLSLDQPPPELADGAEVTISQLDRPSVELTLSGPTPQKPNVNFSFSLISTFLRNRKWSLSGPYQQTESSYIGDGKLALSKTGDDLYKLTTNGIEMMNIPENARTVVSIPSNFPSFSWATNIALDTKRGIVTVASLGGEGFLYRLDIKSKSWIDFRSLNNIDILSLSYDANSDRYVGWTDEGKLIFISGNGDALFTKKVIDRLPGFGRLYDKGNNRAPRVTIAPNGNDIALIYISGNVVRSIWHYSLSSESALLTYQSGNTNVPIAREN